MSGGNTGVTVPTMADFESLAARVAKLEQGGVPPDPAAPSQDGTKVTAAGAVLITNDGTQWRLTTSATAGNQVQFAPKASSTWALAGSTQQVTGLEKWSDGIYQWSTANGSRYGKPGWWRGAMASASAFGGWSDVPGDPSAPAAPAGAGPFTVDANGFRDASGTVWWMRGLNAGVRDVLDDRHCMEQFPHMNMLRINANSGADSAGDIDAAVKKAAAYGVAVLLEDHSKNTRNLAWFQSMAQTYKSNGLVMLGTPNEPSGNVAQDQIDVVNAIRGAGFTNPIGLQCKGGYDFAHLQTVLNACGKTQLFCTPHIYYAGSDPNGSQSYIDADLNNCKNLGLTCLFGEFGDGMDGWHRDQYGIQLCRQVIAAQQAGRCGALFWAMDNDNHSDGCCSAYAVRDGSRLTSPVMGADPVAPWLRPA